MKKKTNRKRPTSLDYNNKYSVTVVETVISNFEVFGSDEKHAAEEIKMGYGNRVSVRFRQPFHSIVTRVRKDGE